MDETPHLENPDPKPNNNDTPFPPPPISASIPSTQPSPLPHPPSTPTTLTSTNIVNPPNAPLIRFPPFPNVPEGVTILPFKAFREHGIQIFTTEDGEEIDGLGIPTVALRVPHDTDVCKTDAKKKKKGRKKRDGENGEGDGDEEGGDDEAEAVGRKGKKKPRIGDVQPENKKLTPIERAQEQRRKRLLLFANNPWYIQWAEGEDLRGTRIYDTNLSPIDRIHMAATEFRTGRIWPPGHTRVRYLWDQFRLFAGLLGSPPVWIRTDLAQSSDYGSSSSDQEDDDDDPKSHKARVDSASDSESEFLATTSDSKKSPKATTPTASTQLEPDQTQPDQKRKRIPPRTPYALANLIPILVSSDAQVRALLALSSTRRENKLLRFLADPEHATRVFLSWYLRHEGLMWSPVHIVALPHLVRYFLAFVVRVRALPESERSLRKAVEVARRAVEELPKMGRLCRALPDKVGAGTKAMWGARWVDKGWGWVGAKDDQVKNEDENEERKKAEEVRKFEEELKKENVILMPADPAELGQASAEQQLASMGEEAEDVLDEDTKPEVEDNQQDEPNADRAGFFEQLAQAYGGDTSKEEPTEKPKPPPTTRVWPRRDADDDSSEEDEANNTRHLHDWANPAGPKKRSPAEAAAAWAPSTEQPLMELLGMTLFPFKYDTGVVERSMRKVKAVYKPGEVDKEHNRKWKGVDEELVRRLARVVLSPWSNWEEVKVKKEEEVEEGVGMGVPFDYRVPEVQVPGASDSDAKQSSHDALQDDITLLLEPRVAELVCVGVGIAGTWVQLVPVREEFGFGAGSGGRGRGRGRGGGGGRGGRGGSSSNLNSGVGGAQKETRFWYVEEIYMAIPSFWTLGEPEEELVLPDDFESLLEDDG